MFVQKLNVGEGEDRDYDRQAGSAFIDSVGRAQSAQYLVAGQNQCNSFFLGRLKIRKRGNCNSS